MVDMVKSALNKCKKNKDIDKARKKRFVSSNNLSHVRSQWGLV